MRFTGNAPLSTLGVTFSIATRDISPAIRALSRSGGRGEASGCAAAPCSRTTSAASSVTVSPGASPAPPAGRSGVKRRKRPPAAVSSREADAVLRRPGSVLARIIIPWWPKRGSAASVREHGGHARAGAGKQARRAAGGGNGLSQAGRVGRAHERAQIERRILLDQPPVLDRVAGWVERLGGAVFEAHRHEPACPDAGRKQERAPIRRKLFRRVVPGTEEARDRTALLAPR